MIYSPETSRALEFSKLLAVVAELAASDLGRDWIGSLEPHNDAGRLQVRRDALEELQRLLQEGGSLVPSMEEPVAPLRQALERPKATLGGGDLVQLARLLEVCHKAQDRIYSGGEGGHEGLGRELSEVGLSREDRELSQELVRRIRRVLDPRGEVRDGASSRLKALCEAVRQRRDALYTTFSGYVSQHGKALGEDTISLRGGRLTVLLPAGSRGRLPGLLHGRSARGKSFYFEPLEMVEGNNELQQSLDDEAAERRRLLAELAQRVSGQREGLIRQISFLRLLDGLQALQRFAEVAAARLPEIAPPNELRLVDARHPLLDPRLASLRLGALGSAGHEGEIVPLQLEFGADHVLVVTGPNAGGKTVVLKTLGLLAMAAQTGIPVPLAEGSRLPMLRSLVALVGDEQDLLAERSTFSARLIRLKEAWAAAGAGSLILLDETGSGTDPHEGAALAVALMEGLAEEGGLALMTTHLTELAAAALRTPGAACLAMDVEAESRQPTFHLRSGPPASSDALALARRLGLPVRWIERAEAHLGPEQRHLRQLLNETEALRGKLESQRDALAQVQAEQESLRRTLAEELEALQAERASLRHDYRETISEWRRTVRGQMQDEVDRLAAAVAEGRRKNLARQATERLFSEPPELLREPQEEAGKAEPIEPGQRVRHRDLGWTGVVERVRRHEAEVRVSGKRLRCRAAELSPAERSVGTPGGRRSAGRISSPDPSEQASEINLVGQRVEPALDAVDRYLDRALLGTAATVRVIHGHGSGRLRQALRQHLEAHPAVSGLRPADRREGGDGATIVTLKG